MSYKFSLFILFLFIFFIPNIFAQDYSRSPIFYSKQIQSPYLDIGGMFLPISNSTVNFNIGFGYQLSTLTGVGVSFTSTSSWETFNDKFNGFGVDYRIQTKNIWFKNTVGFINNYFPSQKSVHHEPISPRNKFFYRASIGWIPKGGIFKIGLAYHLTDNGLFETRECALPPPNCEVLFTANRRVNNVQFYIGFHLPNPSRKSLERSYLLR